MLDETNAYAVKINGVTFVSMDAAKSIVDEARQDGWNLALDEAAREVEKWQQVHFDDGGNMHVSNITSTIAAAIRALKENADDKT